MKYQKRIVALLAAIAMTAAMATSAIAAEAADTADAAEPVVTVAPLIAQKSDVARLGGDNRYETAALISEKGWEKAETVVIVNANSYADALAGTPLAYAYDAPILLTDGKDQNKSTAAEISRLGAKKVYILGGTAVVGENIEKLLTDSGCSVIRLAGATRYETAVAVAKELEKKSGKKAGEAFIASANNYPDALAISPIAAIKGAPILYIDKSGKLNEATAEYLKECNGLSITILGGTGAIAGEANDNIKAAAGEYVQRIGGTDRYDTNLKINDNYSMMFEDDAMCIATGKNFPDALAGGVLAAKQNAPMLLVDGTQSELSKAQSDYVAACNPENVIILGGKNAVSTGIENALSNIIDKTEEPSSSDVTPTDAPSKEEIDKQFIGKWACDRCSIEITAEGEGYKCAIHWGNSAFESTCWEYVCTYDEVSDSIINEGLGVKSIVSYDEKGNASSKNIFTDGSAKFEVNKDGKLTWIDYKEYAAEDMLFERYTDEEEPVSDSDTPSKEEIDKQFIGEWACGRCSIEITAEGEGYKCAIHWGNSAFESTCWEYVCTYDEVSNSIINEGLGVKSIVSYDEKGNASSKNIFTDGSAKFEVNKDGKLTWIDYKEYAAENMLFERYTEEETSVSNSDLKAFVGTWACGRCAIEITETKDGAACSIMWGDSAARTYNWEYTCAYDKETGTLKDTGSGVKTRIDFDQDSKETKTELYKDGAAEFSIDKDGKLVWKDAKENAGEDMSFIIAK